eukprot:CAMPEP_0179248044 /NCGR_PEP_ID=MMETSP0797-20121207/19923_1 /TAXON_ID=47934 /ORGANISM="Dinophysis acuminata, Strain DAEP01" /LENGTH=315 /DNA_ID=CAMNT_0020955685 /DNA_START=74 /DNA_END=1019 /DNA_ORIENTATION=-
MSEGATRLSCSGRLGAASNGPAAPSAAAATPPSGAGLVRDGHPCGPAEDRCLCLPPLLLPLLLLRPARARELVPAPEHALRLLGPRLALRRGQVRDELEAAQVRLRQDGPGGESPGVEGGGLVPPQEGPLLLAQPPHGRHVVGAVGEGQGDEHHVVGALAPREVVAPGERGDDELVPVGHEELDGIIQNMSGFMSPITVSLESERRSYGSGWKKAMSGLTLTMWLYVAPGDGEARVYPQHLVGAGLPVAAPARDPGRPPELLDVGALLPVRDLAQAHVPGPLPQDLQRAQQLRVGGVPGELDPVPAALLPVDLRR